MSFASPAATVGKQRDGRPIIRVSCAPRLATPSGGGDRNRSAKAGEKPLGGCVVTESRQVIKKHKFYLNVYMDRWRSEYCQAS